MTHNDMLGGFYQFRPHAWAFLGDLHSDPEALLYLEYPKVTKYLKIHNMTEDGLQNLL